MKEKRLTKILMSVLLVLISIAVIVIAFVGIYVPKSNKLKNIIPEYKLGTEVDGIIEYRLIPDDSEEEKEVYVDSKGNVRGVVSDGSETASDSEEEVVDSVEATDTETESEDVAENETNAKDDTGFSTETRTIKKNEDAVLTVENFEKSKNIIEQRLENAGATEYAIRVDKETGNMVIELSQNDDISYLYQVALSSIGEFDIIDYQTGVVLMDKSHLVDATTATNIDQETNTYTIYLQLTFDEAGTNIIKEMSKQYIKFTDSNGEEKTDYISVRVDGSSVMRTYFGEEYTQSVLNIPIYSSVEASDVNTYATSVQDIAYMLKQETIPVKYVQDGGALFIESSVSDNVMKIVYWSIIAILILVELILIITYKIRGFLAGIMNACLIGLTIIVIKYTKVVISISSIVALYAVVLLNFIFIIRYLKKLKAGVEKPYLETIKEFYSVTFPLIVIAFVYTFFVSATITGLGSVVFWGMLLQSIYNTVVVKYVLEEK